MSNSSGTITLNSNNTHLTQSSSNRTLTDKDFELSMTLDQTTKYLQKTNKSLNNKTLFDNHINAFADDKVQHDANAHLACNKKVLGVEEV
eukprot:CAMPEP_0116895340 /NCGR_PEP_ID=MMETSP0467-20121206/4887_1 /TAXON_ID=283647 /ORGANISM="Mesodinium pulex, Strain SPMC105" /LENGTH=89 /DNA_ID=CAMNT_0004566019 /DNA_START=1246 /DNA_END=1515 /DNA_ORIENTATION=+